MDGVVGGFFADDFGAVKALVRDWIFGVMEKVWEMGRIASRVQCDFWRKTYSASERFGIPSVMSIRRTSVGEPCMRRLAS